MSVDLELDDARLAELERMLLAFDGTRVRERELWHAFARVYPHRTAGPEERRLLVAALAALESRGTVRLPPHNGRRWDRSLTPAVPKSVDVVREAPPPREFVWRTFPWHANLHWVVDCRVLSAQQLEFLRRVHEALVCGTLQELAPLKYRSLQLTGNEKGLASLATTSLFGPDRLTLEGLGCLPDAVPLAWEQVGKGGRMVIFENAGPFAVARRVLSELPARPYDVVAYGGGRAVLAALGHIRTIEHRFESIHYVGDLDDVGLDIACAARTIADRLGLPPLLPAVELHRQMLEAAAAFGQPQGWASPATLTAAERSRAITFLPEELRELVVTLLQAGRRIPEEVLGPAEMRAAWSSGVPTSSTTG